MDLFEAIKGRRSWRNYETAPLDEGTIEKVIEAGVWAPSPLNSQPWEFIVVTNQEMKEKIYDEAERCRRWAIETSGWNWLEKYNADFLKTVPAMIAVIGDPKGSGIDAFQEEGTIGYQQACAAAVQNMNLAAHALGLGTLWFTFFDKNPLRELLSIDQEKVPLALVCLGKPSGEPVEMRRKGVEKKVTYIR